MIVLVVVMLRMKMIIMIIVINDNQIYRVYEQPTHTTYFPKYKQPLSPLQLSVFRKIHRVFFFLMYCWPCILINLCNENQLDALFILSLFHQSTSTCFGHIFCPSSGGILYIYENWYVLCFLVDCSSPTWTTHSQLKSTICTNCCIYTVYLLTMG